MSYLTESNTSNRKLVALGFAVLLHVGLGYAFVTGLAQDVIKKVITPIETVNVEEEKPIEEEPPPPPPELEQVQVVTPPPVITINTPPPVNTIRTETVVVRPIAPVRVAPPAPPAPRPVIAPPAPPPPAPVVRTPARPRGSGSQISEDDYPPSSLRNEEEGTTRVAYVVGTDGRATNCTVTASSGHPRLDETTCTLIVRRFRFTPAKEGNTPVTENKTQAVRWQITTR